MAGPKGNRSAIGAEIVVETEMGKLVSQIMPTRSYLSQSESIATFGLGNQDKIKRITITWPGGQKKVVQGPPIDQLVRISYDF